MNRFRRLIHRHRWELWGYVPVSTQGLGGWPAGTAHWDICPSCLQMRYVPLAR